MQPTRKEDANRTTSVRRLHVGEEAVGQRLDNYLFKLLKGVPKGRVYRMLRAGEVRVDGHRAKPKQRLEAGSEVRIPPVQLACPEQPTQAAIGRSLLDCILYRDEALLVLDKPAGQAVHGGSGISLGIIEQLRRELPQQRFLELAHRLDKETSGVLLIALKRSALIELHRMLRAGKMRKTYLALALGAWRESERHVRLALRKYRTSAGERRVAVDAEGQAAHTLFRLRSRHGAYSLLEAELKTGRTHQIRVHLAALGHPIAGDDKYGDFAHNRELAKRGLRRMFLHAARIELDHPLSGAPLRLDAPLPQELRRFLDTLPVADDLAR